MCIRGIDACVWGKELERGGGGRWGCWYIRNFVDLTNFNICTHVHVFANIDG